MNSKETSWGGVADWYDDLLEQSEDSFQNKVIAPNIIRIVEPKAGMTILDNACGQGYFSRLFLEKGATVIGCDISPELIARADRNAAQKINFHTTSADNLSFQADASVDVVTIVLALQNIERLAETLIESARVLKSGGRMVFVINHPAFRIPQNSSWGWDETKNSQYRRVDSYISDSRMKIDMTPGEKVEYKKKYTVSFHRPLQVYTKALSKAGLSVIRLEEWISHKKSQKGPRALEEDRIRKEIPMFLCIEAKKF